MPPRSTQLQIPPGYLTTAQVCALIRRHTGFPVTLQTVRNRARAAGIELRRIPRINPQGTPLGNHPVLIYRTADILPLFRIPLKIGALRPPHAHIGL